MQQVKQLFVALMLTIPVLGCGGDSQTTPAQLTTDKIAEQDKVLNEAEAVERARTDAPK
jgi:hypothetical protein